MRKLAWIVGGIALLALLVWCASLERGKPKAFMWAEPSQLKHEIEPGLITRLKFRVLRLPGPFWRWYMRGREQILVETRLLALTVGATQRAEPSSLCWTNRAGVRAWVLSPEKVNGFKQRLNSLPGVSTANSLKLTTFDGGQAEVSDGSPVASTTNSIFAGLSVGLLPKVAGDLLKLQLVATSTATDSSPVGTGVGVVTNLVAACQVLLSNGGGLVVGGAPDGGSHPTNYWIMISAMAVDAQGRPKPLGRERR